MSRCELAYRQAEDRLDPQAGRMLQAVWFSGGKEGQLLLVIHHLAVDGVFVANPGAGPGGRRSRGGAARRRCWSLPARRSGSGPSTWLNTPGRRPCWRSFRPGRPPRRRNAADPGACSTRRGIRPPVHVI